LFPTVEIIDPDYSMLLKQIEIELRAKNKQPYPPFMEKVIYLFETF